MERLDKILSSQGVCSRKDAKKLVAGGRIRVNGSAATRCDIKLDPFCDIITVDGAPLCYRKYLYIMMNKPSGVLSASTDPHAPTVTDILPAELTRRGLFPAGRLEKDTTGLLIISDDGDFAHRMLSPAKKVPKLYEAVLDAPLDNDGRYALEQGITLSDGTQFKPARISFPTSEDSATVHIEITEGKYHQVKRMFAFVEREVVHLKRLRIGGLALDNSLAEGECRELTQDEAFLVFARAEP